MRATRLCCGVIALMTLNGLAAGKSGPTYYTPGRVKTAKENIASYDWAKAVEKRIFKTGDGLNYYIGRNKYIAAETWVQASDTFFWNLMPPTTISRVVYPRDTVAECPTCGVKVKERSVWNPFRIDPMNHPFKVQCPLCKRWWPTNDYANGDMTSGDLADSGDGAVYTGEGPGKGRKYFFLREYAHMCYGTAVIQSLHSFSQAWQLTRDPRYGRKGCILLARLATEFPNYGWDTVTRPESFGVPLPLENRFDRTYLGPWKNQHPHFSWKHGGMITDLIWETFNLETIAHAYDGLYDYMDDDPSMIAFLKERGMPIQNGADLRNYIETYILRAGMVALLKEEVKGNEGFHQATALALALVLDDFSDAVPNSKTMVDYAFLGDGHSAYILVNGLNRDGGGHESPSYNMIKLDFIRVARLMEALRAQHPDLFPLERYPDIFGNPVARAIFDYNIDYLLCGRWACSVGDGGVSIFSKPHYDTRVLASILKNENLYAVERYNDPRFARACLDPETGKPAAGELWETYPEAQITALTQLPASQIQREDRLLDGYGMGYFDAGIQPDKKRGFLLDYTSLRGHRNMDCLRVELYGRNVAFLPDLGYPRQWDYCDQWDHASLTHNTVAVNETNHDRYSVGGRMRLFGKKDGVHVMTASHDPYAGVSLGKEDAPSVTLFERTCVMVEVDADRFYMVDLFAVNGGDQHDQSWHGVHVQPEAPDLPWKAQAKGTLAGEDIPEFGGYVDRWGRQHLKGVRNVGATASFMTDVRRAPLTAPAAWTWRTGLEHGDALALHVVPLGGPAEAIMTRGRNPTWAVPKLDYLFVRRHVEAGAPSFFLTVLDPYRKTPTVLGVSAVGGSAEGKVTVTVKRADGEDTVTLAVPVASTHHSMERALGVHAMVRTKDAPAREARFGSLAGGDGYLRARIAQLDYAAKRIAVPVAQADAEAFAVGRYIRIYNTGRTGMYRIEAVERGGYALAHPRHHRAPRPGARQGNCQRRGGSGHVHGLRQRQGRLQRTFGGGPPRLRRRVAGGGRQSPLTRRRHPGRALVPRRRPREGRRRQGGLLPPPQHKRTGRRLPRRKRRLHLGIRRRRPRRTGADQLNRSHREELR